MRNTMEVDQSGVLFNVHANNVARSAMAQQGNQNWPPRGPLSSLRERSLSDYESFCLLSMAVKITSRFRQLLSPPAAAAISVQSKPAPAIAAVPIMPVAPVAVIAETPVTPVEANPPVT